MPEKPLNLSTKPKSKGIWSPASLCEEESRQNKISTADSSSSESSPNSPNKSVSEDNEEAKTEYPSLPSVMVRNASLFRPFDPCYMISNWNSKNGNNEDVYRNHQGDNTQNSEESSGNYSDCDKADNNKDLAELRSSTPTYNRCDNMFKATQCLDVHVRQTHCSRQSGGSESFPCSRCPKIFEHSSLLEQHLATHHPTRSFQVIFITKDTQTLTCI